MTAPVTTALPTHTDVLIVGAGPAGLTVAASLTQLGVDHVLIERADSVQPGVKAAFVQPRALEYLDRLGVADGLVAAGAPGRYFGFHDGTRSLIRVSYDNLDTPFPTMLLVSQQTTEEHLNRRLAELGGVVHRRHRLIAFSPDFPGVTGTVAAPDGSVRAVFDWELATSGDPLADLGYLVSNWQEPGDPSTPEAPGPTTVPGFPGRAEIVERYARQSGRDVSDVPYWVAFSRWRSACINVGVRARYLAGHMVDDGGYQRYVRGSAEQGRQLGETARNALRELGV